MRKHHALYRFHAANYILQHDGGCKLILSLRLITKEEFQKLEKEKRFHKNPYRTYKAIKRQILEICKTEKSQHELVISARLGWFTYLKLADQLEQEGLLSRTWTTGGHCQASWRLKTTPKGLMQLIEHNYLKWCDPL